MRSKEKHRLTLFYYTVALILSATAIVSCNETKNKIVDISDKTAVPSMEVQDLNVWYSELGETRMLLKAPLLRRYLFLEEPYSVFPNGFFVQFYTQGKELESQITADYALYKEKPLELWKAAGNVVVINFRKNQSLYTDTLYWDRVQHVIYTNSPVRIETADSFFNGWNGMTSDEKFTNYELRNVGDSRYYFNDEPAAQDSLSVISESSSDSLKVNTLPVLQQLNDSVVPLKHRLRDKKMTDQKPLRDTNNNRLIKRFSPQK